MCVALSHRQPMPAARPMRWWIPSPAGISSAIATSPGRRSGNNLSFYSLSLQPQKNTDMKKFIYALAILSCLGLMTGCDKDSPTSQSGSGSGSGGGTVHFNEDVRIGIGSSSFTSVGGTTTLKINSNVSWTASSTESWCKLSQTSGGDTGGKTIEITVTCEANTSSADRSCTLTVKAGVFTNPWTVTIKQSGK